METVPVYSDSGRRYDVGLIQDRWFMGKVRGAAQYVPLYDQRYQGVIADNVVDRIANEWDCIIQCTGKRRTGKSTNAASIARIIDANFPVGNVSFTIDSFNELLSSLPYANVPEGIIPQALYDESGHGLFSQNWMERVQKNLVKKLEVIGMKNLTVWLVLPHRKKLNKSIREEMVHYWIHTTTFEKRRGLAEVRIGLENIWEEEMYWAPLAAYTFDSMAETKWWAGYTDVKRAFVDEIADDPLDDIKGSGAITQRNNAIALVYRMTGLSHGEIAKELELPRGTINTILRGISKRH